MAAQDLETMVREFRDREMIKELTSQYAHYARQKDAKEIVNLFAEDGKVKIGQTVYQGWTELQKYYAEMFERQETVYALLCNHVISLQGDRATGVCSAEVMAIQEGKSRLWTGYYEDEYTRIGTEWKFQSREINFYALPFEQEVGTVLQGKLLQSLVPLVAAEQRRLREELSKELQKELRAEARGQVQLSFYSTQRVFQAEMREQLRQMELKLDAFVARQQQLQEELHGYLIAQSLGLDPDAVPLHRFVPVQVYLSKGDPHQVEQIINAVKILAERFGFEIADDFPPEERSWLKKFVLKTRDVVIQEEVKKRLEKMERAIELEILDKKQANVDKTQAEAVNTLLQGLRGDAYGVCLVGSILIIKRTEANGKSGVVVMTLTQSAMIFLEQNRHLLRDPDGILKALSDYSTPRSETKMTLPLGDQQPHEENS